MTEGKEDNLCDRCSMIDIDQLFLDPYEVSANDPLPVWSLGQLDRELEQSSCSLCCLFYGARINTAEDQNNSSYQLYSMPADVSPDGWSYPRSIAVMSQRDDTMPKLQAPSTIPNARYITCSNHERSMSHRDSDRAAYINPTSIDFNMIRGWIDSSQDKAVHSSSLEQLADINLIDCESRIVVSASVRWDYCALSYVWGKSSDYRQLRSGRLPSGLPKTIEDAIKATSMLGYRYIWIDRYCIDQTNHSEKMRQIKQMDSIYKNAQLTIIASAGNDPNIGLPGVNSTPRLAQYKSWKSGYQLVSYPAFLRENIERSAWISRGWTFQEALFSSRRLYFTEQAVFYESLGKGVSEVFQRDSERYYLDNELPNADQGLAPYPMRLLTYLEWYSGRELTYETDTILAIQGIFNAFNNGTSLNSIVQYKGTPLVLCCWESEHQHAKARKLATRSRGERFLSGLTWMANPWFANKHGRRDIRRKTFPSWSWAGWNVKVWMFLISTYEIFKVHDEVPQVLSERLDGTMCDFNDDESFSEMLEFPDHFSNIICLTTWFIPLNIQHESQIKSTRNYITFIDYSTTPKSEFFCVFEGKNLDIRVEANSSCEAYDAETGAKAFTSEFDTSKVIGIICYEPYPGQIHSMAGDFHILIMQDTGSHYERIGTARASRTNDALDPRTILMDIILHESIKKTIRLG